MTNSSSVLSVPSYPQYARKFRANIRSFSDGWLFIRIFAWATALPLLVRVWSLPRLVHFLTPRHISKRPHHEDHYAEQVAKYTDFVLGRGIWVYQRNCLKRSMILYHFLCRQGIDVQLCLGVRKSQGKPDLDGRDVLLGHAWLVRQGRPYREHASIDTGTYTVTCSYGPPSGLNGIQHLSPEMELFLACGRTQFDSTSPKTITQLLQKPIHWPRFLDLVRQHGLMNCAYNLLAPQQDAVPDEIRTTLGRDCHHFTARSMLLAAELARVTRCLRRADIKVIAYKGPALAKTLFGDTAKRHFNDLDLLIAETDRSRATDVLLAQGYQSHLELSWEHSFVRADSGTMVDLHWALVPDAFHLSLPFGALWQRRRTVTIAGLSVATFGEEDTLIVQCINAAKDDWSSLGQIHEIGLMINTCDLDWQDISACTGTLGCKRIVMLGVALSAHLFGAPLPPEVRERFDGDKSQQQLRDDIAARLLQPPGAGAKVLLLDRLRARSRERFRERLPHYRRMLSHALRPNEKDHEFLPLPRCLFPAYFVLRPIRLIRKHVLSAQDSRAENTAHDTEAVSD